MMEHLFLKLGELTFYMLVFAAAIIPSALIAERLDRKPKRRSAVR